MKVKIDNWWELMQNLIKGTRTMYTFDNDGGEQTKRTYIFKKEKLN